MLAGESAIGQERLNALYEPQEFEGMPCRVMKPLEFDAKQSYPVIVSLHGAGGKGTGNDKQLKDWRRLQNGAGRYCSQKLAYGVQQLTNSPSSLAS